ncbi:MAG: TIGR01212 family radical SAM protein [Clostridia bacterium]|nr:TIGR01212 family radical SAM protein [Clostridia bacterium]
MLYYNLSTYLRERYGKRLKKICIDGGFSCPNRDGKCGTGGCVFCGERGAGEHIDPTASIGEQVRAACSGAAADDGFIAYFQNFTNTYAPVEVLKERYDAALVDDRIRILSIGTRPDCISEEICSLLEEYQKEREVWVELGLQTVSDETARLINRGYPLSTFESALAMLKAHGIPVVVHVIFGLPGESREAYRKTADYLASLGVFGVKIHSIYVMHGTRLAEMYGEKRYTPPTLSDFAEAAAYAVARLPEDTVIHRLTGDCPRDLLIAPEWNSDKNAVLEAIRSELIGKGYRQGSLFEE